MDALRYNEFLNLFDRDFSELLMISLGNIQLTIEGPISDLIVGNTTSRTAKRNTLEIYGTIDTELFRYYDAQLQEEFLQLDYKARSMDWNEVEEVHELKEMSELVMSEHYELIY